MEYNKQQFQKTANKKILHKVKKHWVVLSTALLVALAGSATLLGGTSVHAEADNGTGDTAGSGQTGALKSRINASLVQSRQQNVQDHANARNQKIDPNALAKQASTLHNRILANAASGLSVNQTSHQVSRSTAIGRTSSVKPVTLGDDADQVQLHNIPVTVKYLDSAGKLQKDQNNRPRVGTAYASLAGDPGASGQLSRNDESNSYLYMGNYDNGSITPADNGYNYAAGDRPSNFKASINSLGTKHGAFKLNNSALQPETYSDTNVSFGDNWDSTNNRPLFILKAADPNRVQISDVPVTVKFVNSDGTIQQTNKYDDSYSDGGKRSYNGLTVTGKNHPKIITAYADLAGDQGGSAHFVVDQNVAGGSDAKAYLNNDPRDILYNDSDFSPITSGYSYVNGDQPADFSAQLTDNGYQYQKPANGRSETYSDANVKAGDNWDSTNNRPLFILKAQNAKDINVNYINETGYSVREPNANTNYDISGKGRYGDSLNVWDPSRGGYAIPYSKDYRLDSDETRREYTFGDYPQNVTVPLEGKRFVPNDRNYQKDNAKYQKDNRKIDNNDNYLTVNVYAKANAKDRNGQHYYVKSDGSFSASPVVYKRISKYIGGQIGNFTTVDPHASWLTSQVKGYDPAPQQSDVQIYFDNDMDSDGNGLNDGYGIMGTMDNAGNFKKLNDQSINFTYDANQYTGTAKNINLTYVDQNRKLVGKKTLAGNQKDYGRTVNVTQSADGGLNVPSGYMLDSDQPVNYVFNSDVQNVQLTVHGDNAMTNHEVKIDHNKKSVDQDPLTITLERDYYSSDGRTFKGKSDAATVHPNIYGEVGNSVDVIPSSFLQYVARKGANVEPLVDRPQSITFNGNGTVTPNKFTLRYKVIPIRSKRSTIRIHYVSVNPDGTDNLNGMDIPNTEVSDNNFANYSFGVHTKSDKDYTGDNYYRLNVPKGYQFDKILKINGKAVNNESDVAGITHFADHDQDEVIEVIPNAGNMTIHYIDQSNHPVYTETESGSSDQALGEAPGHTSRYGELFPAYRTRNGLSPADANDIITPQGHVLTNYHVSRESTAHYFTRNPQDVYVMVAGNQAPDYSSKYTANIHIHEENPNGIVTNSYTVPDQISGDIGDSYTVNADSYTPDDYRIAPGTDSSVTGTITPQGISKRSIDFYYVYNNDQTYKDLKGIDVIYEDDEHQVGFNQIDPQPNDYQGEDIDVTTRGNDGYQLPAGYQLDPDQNTHSSFGVNQYNQLILQVYKPQSQVQGNFTIIQRLYRNSTHRSDLMKTVYKVVPEAGAVGDTFRIDPHDYEVDGFTEVKDNLTTGRFTPTGISPATAEFYYVATDSKNNSKYPNHGNKPSHPSDNGPIGPVSPKTAEPIYVQYYQGEGTSDPVGSDVRVDGYMGQDFSDITKSAPVPKDYYLLQGQNLNYTISDQERQVDLHVEKANAQARNFPLTIKLESPSDNLIGQRTQNIMVNGNSSDEITPSDYDPDSVNFRLDTRQHRDQDIDIVNKDGQLTPAQATYYYIADSRHHNPNPNQPSDVNIQPITVNYINRSDGKGVQSYTLSDGYMDQTVNVTAQNLAPVPDHYHLNPSNQNVNYTFGDRPQTANLLISGDPNNSGRDDLVVDSTLIHSDGRVTQGIPDNVTLQSQYGGQVVFNPQELINDGYLPSSYHLIPSKVDPSDAPQTVHFNDNGTITPSTLHFTYEQNRTNPSQGQAAGLLNVNYINQNNQRVGGGLISGHKIGDVINDLASSKDGGIDIPHNYHLDSSKRQALNYKFTINDAVRNIYVVGNQDNDQNKNRLDVHLIEIHNDGTQTTKDINKYMNYDVGDNVMVYPNEFTPSDYYVNPADVPAQITVNPDDTITPNKVSFLYNQETNSDAGNITVSYYNQMGKLVGKPDVISGRYNNNKTINVTNTNPYTNDMVIGDAVPDGYHLVSGQQTEYTFGINPQNVQLRVQGDPVNSDTDQNQLTIHVNERSSDTTNSKVVSSKTYRKYIHENVGSDQTFSPNQYVPSADKFSAKGYHVDSSDQVANVMMQADHSIQPKQITWNYSPNNDEAQPLTLSYIDVQTGQRVGCITRIDGYIGQTIPNVTHESDGGGAVPAGYSLINNEDQTVDPQTHKPYVLSNKAQNVQLKVEGNVQTVPFIVHEILSDGEGDIKLKTVDYRLPANSDRVGDTTVVTPNTKGVTPNPSDNPNGYQVAPSDQKTSVKVHVNNGSLSPSCALFHYVLPVNMQKAGPITVTFINQDGHQVGESKTINGHINQKVNALHQNGDPNKPYWIPDGYQLASGTDPSEYNRIMMKYPQSVVVQVQGEERQASFTVYVTKLDLHGNRMGDTQTVPLSLKNHRVGSDVQISPYMDHLTPAGYHADSSDKSIDVTINNNGTCSPVDSAYYNYTLNYLPPLIGRINVHYVTSQGAPQNSSSDVDVVSDHGISGDRFNLAPYQEDLPDTVEKGYHATGNVFDRNGNRYDVSNIRFNGEQEKDIYIQVAPNSTADMQNSADNTMDTNNNE